LSRVKNVTVFGLGYVGSVSAACLADLGHQVTGIDRDEVKVQHIRSAQAPFYEPGLRELIERTVRAGRLTATTSVTEALETADVALLCVGTPSERNGNLSLDQLRRVAGEIAGHTAARNKPLTVAVRSTVFPGTCEQIVMPLFAGQEAVRVVCNPEFLREGVAVKDFLEPSLLVVGGDDPEAVRTVAGLYEKLPVQGCLVSLRTAEMIKYACNAYHAVKVAFANEIGSVSAALGIDGREVMATLCRDTKLNVSAAYLKPGFAFGGSCLPKDLRALNYRASSLDLQVPLLAHVLESNHAHLRRACDAVLGLTGPVGVFGLAFKENTDDLRESPVISLLEYLIGKGRELAVYDPHIRLEAIHGSNRNFVLNAIPHIGRLLAPDLPALLGRSAHVVLAQKPDAANAALIRESGKPVLDLTGSQS
jgi:GDP-mannose 6-dehydrogenase